jgi:hypothetical protein
MQWSGRRVVIGFIRLVDYFDVWTANPVFVDELHAGGHRMGTVTSNLGFTTLGSFRVKPGGPNVCRRIPSRAHARGPTVGWTRPVRAAGNACRSGLTNEGRVLSDTEPVELLRLSFLRLWPLP